jgi:hypothetical protein
MSFATRYDGVAGGWPTTTSANTKGAWVEYVASSPYDSSRIWVNIQNNNSTDRYTLQDVGVGAAASEVAVLDNLFYHSSDDFLDATGAPIPFDLDIASGTRISTRLQSSTSGTQGRMQFWLEDKALGSGPDPETWGANTADSGGTDIDCGATPDTYSAWTELSASIANDCNWFLGFFGHGSPSEVIGGTMRFLIDVASGAAASEVALIEEMHVISHTETDGRRPPHLRFPIDLSSGDRVSVRALSSTGTAGDRVLSIVGIGSQEVVASPGGGGGTVASAHVG